MSQSERKTPRVLIHSRASEHRYDGISRSGFLIWAICTDVRDVGVQRLGPGGVWMEMQRQAPGGLALWLTKLWNRYSGPAHTPTPSQRQPPPACMSKGSPSPFKGNRAVFDRTQPAYACPLHVSRGRHNQILPYQNICKQAVRCQLTTPFSYRRTPVTKLIAPRS